MEWELDWLKNRARLTPNNLAVIDAESEQGWTYEQLNERANALAHFLKKKNIEKGDRIALISPNHISYFDLMFACAKLGAIFVPLNWRLSIEEINYILGDCTPKLVGYHHSFLDIVKELFVTESSCFSISSTKYEQEVSAQNTNLSFNGLEEDPLAMIYTGGTTGKPKGVVLSHRAIFWNGMNTIVSWNLTAEDTTLTYLPMFHTGGLNALSIPLLMMGGTVVISSQFDPEKAIENLHKYKCTIALFVPTMYQLMIQTEVFSESTFPTMKVFLSGGAPCPLGIYEVFIEKGLAFKEGYGLTEAGPNNFYIAPEDAKKYRGSVGKPMLFNQVKLVLEDGSEAKGNEVGELLIKGKHQFSCYWNNHEATAATLQDNWLYTGDLAKKNEDGYYYIVGRKKEMIITGGENVYPLEIEQCIMQHPYVSEAAVVGLPDQLWGEIVTAFVSMDGQQRIVEEELKVYCQQKLAKYKIPKRFIQMDELPKTHVGKMDKKRLTEMGAAMEANDRK